MEKFNLPGFISRNLQDSEYGDVQDSSTKGMFQWQSSNIDRLRLKLPPQGGWSIWRLQKNKNAGSDEVKQFISLFLLFLDWPVILS